MGPGPRLVRGCAERHHPFHVSASRGRAGGLLLALHGCQTNHLVVLYPQAIATGSTGSNPQGCGDWWGYLNDPDYALRSGPQMQALHRMVVQASGGAARQP